MEQIIERERAEVGRVGKVLDSEDRLKSQRGAVVYLRQATQSSGLSVSKVKMRW